MYLPGVFALVAPCILPFILLSTAIPLDTDTLNVRAELLHGRTDVFALSPRPGLDYHGTISSHLGLSSRSTPAVSVGNNWFITFEQYTWVIPVQPAVDKLLVFYDALQAEAASRGTQNTVSALTQFGKGNLRLDILCEGALPWHFIGGFAEWMLGVTSRGFAGLYTARVIHAATGVPVTVTLQIMAAAAAAT